MTVQHVCEPRPSEPLSSVSLELHTKVTSITQVVTTSPLDNSLDILPEPEAILSLLSPWTQAANILDNSRNGCQKKTKTCWSLLVREKVLEIYSVKLHTNEAVQRLKEQTIKNVQHGNCVAEML